jgi:hypothetical protein
MADLGSRRTRHSRTPERPRTRRARGTEGRRISGICMGVASIVPGRRRERRRGHCRDCSRRRRGPWRPREARGYPRAGSGECRRAHRRGLHRFVDTPKPPWAEPSAPISSTPAGCRASSLARLGRGQSAQPRTPSFRDSAQHRRERSWDAIHAPADGRWAYYEGLVRAFARSGSGRLVDEADRIVGNRAVGTMSVRGPWTGTE